MKEIKTPRISGLPLLCLSLIKKSKKGITGYDITLQIGKRYQSIWKSSHQQVYRELRKMAQKGYINSKLIKQDAKPDKKVYSITELGEAHLRDEVSFMADTLKSEAVQKKFTHTRKLFSNPPERDCLMVILIAAESYGMEEEMLTIIQCSMRHFIECLAEYSEQLEVLSTGSEQSIEKELIMHRLEGLRVDAYNKHKWLKTIHHQIKPFTENSTGLNTNITEQVESGCEC